MKKIQIPIADMKLQNQIKIRVNKAWDYIQSASKLYNNAEVKLLDVVGFDNIKKRFKQNIISSKFNKYFDT